MSLDNVVDGYEADYPLCRGTYRDKSFECSQNIFDAPNDSDIQRGRCSFQFTDGTNFEDCRVIVTKTDSSCG